MPLFKTVYANSITKKIQWTVRKLLGNDGRDIGMKPITLRLLPAREWSVPLVSLTPNRQFFVRFRLNLGRPYHSWVLIRLNKPSYYRPLFIHKFANSVPSIKARSAVSSRRASESACHALGDFNPSGAASAYLRGWKLFWLLALSWQINAVITCSLSVFTCVCRSVKQLVPRSSS